MGGFIICLTSCSVLRTKWNKNKEFIKIISISIVDLHNLGLFFFESVLTMFLLFSLKNKTFAINTKFKVDKDKQLGRSSRRKR
jgi:hypothetical protein